MGLISRYITLLAFLFLAAGLLNPRTASAIGYPHYLQNEIECQSCHTIHGGQPELMPPWTVHEPQNIDDTQKRTLCWSCHCAGDSDTCYETHSSRQTDDSYGHWTVDCVVCHEPHYQMQAYTFTGDSDYVFTGTVDGVTATTLTMTGAGWEDDQFAGMILSPDKNNILFNYKIVGNTDETLTVDANVATDEVDGTMNLGLITIGGPFAISYGKIIRTGVRPIDLGRIAVYPDPDSSLDNPAFPKVGTKLPKFVRPENDNSFSDGDSTYDGICEVCHDQTTHFRNDGSGSDQLHANVGYPAREKCTRCHSHSNGFMHGSGSSGCSQCHGHDGGSDYDLDMQFPNDELDGQSMGAGTSWSHSTHTENDNSGHSDLMGPMVDDSGILKPIYCDTCHDTSSMPLFKNLDGSGGHTLDETDICNNCHSPGGTYNGVNSVTESVGAKDNWRTGVYNADRTLQFGKEKWCAGCHDEDPANSLVDGSGIDAPKIVGDEDGNFNYGTGWGFYKTGHGVPADETYPASGGITSGAGKICSDCHDQTTPHLDGDSRSFDCDNSSGGACSADYQVGYRLKDVDGELPMEIPQTGQNLASYRLCFSCHTNTDDWLQTPASAYRGKTNFYDNNQTTVKKNLHIFHLNSSQGSELDWDAGTDGDMSCITCHNVHGSRNIAMIRSGELTGWPSMTARYGNACSTHTEGDEEPVPDNITLAISTRSTMLGRLTDSYCSHCHGHGTGIISVDRTPTAVPDSGPELDWVGGPAYESDGADPDAAPSGTEFTFKVEYSDVNEDEPDIIQLWIDRDGDGSYVDNGDPALDEKIELTSVFVEPDTCAPYSTGVDYATSLTLDKSLLVSGNTITYRFFAGYGGTEATGPPTGESELTLLNDAPRLEWTGEAGYEHDGVNPDYGPRDGTYVFRVRYTDNDGDACPASDSDDIQVWIDLDGGGSYDGGEMFNLTEVSAADTDCTAGDSGKLYYTDQVLPNASGSSITYDYRFHASDGTSDATGEPVSPGGTVTVAGTGNNPPLLAWDSGTCRPEGAMPPRSAPSSVINFSIRYFDEDNECPSGGGAGDIQVYVDLDNSGTYAGEQFDLYEADPGDMDCTAAGGGKLYASDIAPTTVADGITYEFHATDGTDEALGEPRTAGGTVDVIDADHVVRQDGTEDYTTISAALSGGSGGDVILVYEGTYNEYLAWPQWQSRHFYSACGPEETIITHGNDPVVFFNHSSVSTLDGFTITGSSGRGVFSDGTNFDGLQSRPTIRDCIIRNNSGRGIEGAESNVTITGCEIRNNTGGGVLSYNTTITDTVIRNNSVTGNGGGIASRNPGGNFTLTNVVLKDNTATGSGGGIYCRHSSNSSYAPSYEKVTLTGNSSSGTGGGGYFSYCHPTFTNSLVADNNSPSGGGIRVESYASAWFENSTIVNNTATAGDGGAFNSTDGPVSLANSIAWGNRASVNGHTGYFSGNDKDIYLYDSIIENNGDENITDDNYFYHTEWNTTIHDTGTNYDTDPNFVNPGAFGNYHVLPPSDAIDQAADNSGRGIPADDLEGSNRPAGSEDIGAYEFPQGGDDAQPVLSWTGQPGFSTDGVSPDEGAGAADYEFRVEYSHGNNTPPDAIEVWIDQNGNGSYEGNEKYAMAVLVSGDAHDDGDYTNGERYTLTTAVYHDGGGYVNYRFYASDGKDLASEEPTMTHMFYVHNAVPVLAWAGDADYVADGVHPDEDDSGSAFVFRVLYTDQDNLNNTAPSTTRLWIDLDDDGSYESGSEYFDLTPEPGADAYHDGNFANGEIFVSSPITLNFSGDGILAYRFYFTDGTDPAIGSPTADKTVSLTNTPPSLDWTGESNFSSDGVDPDTGNSGDSYEFRVDYFDADNTPPSLIQVWIDLDDSGTYESGEMHDLAKVVSGDIWDDGNYVNGERYFLSHNIAYAGDGILNYRFYATDGRDDASGAPVSTGGTLQIVEGLVEVNFIADAQTTDESTATYTITAQLDAAIGDDVTVPFTVTGTATGGGTDYTVTSSPITITAGQLSADITVDVAADVLDEDDETVIVTMEDPINAVKGTADVHTLTITDDDPEPSVTFTSASQATTDESGDHTVTAQLSAVSGRDVSVPYTLGGDAVENDDYTVSPNPLVIPAGDVDADITVSIIGDSDYEGNETVTVTMGAPTHATQGATTVHSLTITDDDGSPALRTVLCAAPDPVGDYQYTTIQDAIDAALGGETVLVCDGTYSENIDFGGRNITVRSLNGAALTIIQGDGSNTPVVTFGSSETADTVLDGFTIDNTAANSATRGVYIYGASPTVRNCTIQGNAADNSSVDGIQVGGGGIFVKNGAPVIDGCIVRTNTGTNRSGGGIYYTGSVSGMIISNSEISDNSANYGPGIYAELGMTVTDTDITDNNGASYGHGGGMYLTGADQATTFTGGSITGHNVQNGSGVYITGGADLTVDGGAVVSGNLGWNPTGGGQGGGAYINGSGSTLTCSKAFFAGNDADQYGGAIYNNGGSLTMTNCNVTGNTADGQTYGRGGGIFTTGSATVAIYSSTIAGNYAYYGGGGLYHEGGATTATNSIFWDNAAGSVSPEIYGTVSATYCDVEGGYSGTGNVDLDPMFVSPAAAVQGNPETGGDFHIQSGSSVIDQGTATGAPADDIDGDSRPQGYGIDMGSDENYDPSPIVTLYPSALAAEGNGNFAATGGAWGDVLDSNDGDSSYVSVCCQNNGTFYVDLDDPGIGAGATINSVTVNVVVRNSDVNPVDIGYKTGTVTIWKGNTSVGTSYTTLTLDAPTNSDGGAWSLTDLDNMKVAVRRNYNGPTHCYVTAVNVEVNYTP